MFLYCTLKYRIQKKKKKIQLRKIFNRSLVYFYIFRELTFWTKNFRCDRLDPRIQVIEKGNFFHNGKIVFLVFFDRAPHAAIMVWGQTQLPKVLYYLFFIG